MATTDGRTGKRVLPMRNVANDAQMLDVATVARVTCPFCGAACAPPCVCMGCGVGIPDGTEADWLRHLTPTPTR